MVNKVKYEVNGLNNEVMALRSVSPVIKTTPSF